MSLKGRQYNAHPTLILRRRSLTEIHLVKIKAYFLVATKHPVPFYEPTDYQWTYRFHDNIIDVVCVGVTCSCTYSDVTMARARHPIWRFVDNTSQETPKFLSILSHNSASGVITTTKRSRKSAILFVDTSGHVVDTRKWSERSWKGRWVSSFWIPRSAAGATPREKLAWGSTTLECWQSLLISVKNTTSKMTPT